MSINYLEKMAGVSRGSICKWGFAGEDNKVEPGIWKLEKVAQILGLSVEQLIKRYWGSQGQIGQVTIHLRGGGEISGVYACNRRKLWNM